MMNPTEAPPSEAVKFSEQLKKHFSDEQIAAFLLTTLGMSDLAHGFIWEQAKEFMEIPVAIKYSAVQHAALYRFFGFVMREELDSYQSMHMSVDKKAWKSNEDFEKRFIFVVKAYYEELKKQGKL